MQKQKSRIFVSLSALTRKGKNICEKFLFFAKKVCDFSIKLLYKLAEL